MKHKLRYRQIHLDFHTSPQIPAIGAAFDKKHWQDTLKEAAVDSITCFAVGHHGWSYFDTKVGKRHPHLDFDLLRAQMDASKEINVNVPVYITAGVHNMFAHEHPEWREIDCNGQYSGWACKVLDPGFHKMCFNTPYLDYLCDVIKEVTFTFPEADGIFLDIIFQGQCCCRWCIDDMEKGGFDAENPSDRARFAKGVLMKYFRETTKAVHDVDPAMPVFHNSGHITRGEREQLEYFSHLELESLPTGGWGYDHFPMSAKYCQNLDFDFMGMTGKFHTTWGEFGGYKHPNALRYECASMLAFGAKCSVGDQLHPDGKLDQSTYKIIGEAYRDVEKKEKWCVDAKNVADIAIVSSAALNRANEHMNRENAADIGACRMLLEGHFLFDVLDEENDFSPYKMLILPDDCPVDAKLKSKLDVYLAAGGKLLLNGRSALKEDCSGFHFDIGAEFSGESEYQPDYVAPIDDLRPSFCESPMVMYLKPMRIKASTGRSLGKIHDPYFNRSFRHFCSHQHTPPKPEPSEFDCGVINGNILYLAHPVFSIYRAVGAVAYQEYCVNAIKMLLGDGQTVKTNMPSTARVNLNLQEEQRRFVLHLLYANTINRGGVMTLSGGTVENNSKGVEVIQELLPLGDVEVSLKLTETVTKVLLEPQGMEIPFESDGNTVKIKLDSFTCHQMIVLEY